MQAQIKIADKAGFCFGVDRAVKIVYNVLNKGEKAATYGEIIHNPNVVADLRANGVRVIESIDEISELENCTVVIRSHGVGKDVYSEIERYADRGVSCCDGTCPFVARIHNIVSEKSSEGYDIIILGDKDHPEVRGIVGFCNNIPYFCSDDVDLSEFLKKNSRNLKKRLQLLRKQRII